MSITIWAISFWCDKQIRMRGAKSGFQASGWTRVDPTTAVAPGRASLDLNSFLERRGASGQIEGRRSALVSQLARSALFTNVRLVLETLSYQWDTRLLAFDADVQEVLLDSIGLANRGPLVLMIEIVIVAVALLVIYFGWMQLRTRSRADRVKALYERFCQRAARLGVRRDPWEGPSDFSRRAAQLLPNESERIRQISDTYIGVALCARIRWRRPREVCQRRGVVCGTSIDTAWISVEKSIGNFYP